MLDHDTAALSGPDQLDAIADQAEGSGLQTNAEAFRRLARQWRRDQHALENVGGAPAWAAHLEAFIGPGALPSLHRSFDAGESPRRSCCHHRTPPRRGVTQDERP